MASESSDEIAKLSLEERIEIINYFRLAKLIQWNEEITNYIEIIKLIQEHIGNSSIIRNIWL